MPRTFGPSQIWSEARLSGPVERLARTVDGSKAVHAPPLDFGCSSHLQVFSVSHDDRPRYAVFFQTETCEVLSLVKGSRVQPLQRSRKVMPAIRAIRSSSDGHT